eukprot:9296897-Pyramimonas_sp.AAC.1
MGTNGEEFRPLGGTAGKLQGHRQDGKSRTLALILPPVPHFDPIFSVTWLPVKCSCMPLLAPGCPFRLSMGVSARLMLGGL